MHLRRLTLAFVSTCNLTGSSGRIDILCVQLLVGISPADRPSLTLPGPENPQSKASYPSSELNSIALSVRKLDLLARQNRPSNQIMLQFSATYSLLVGDL